jgi:hypothetical protein
MTMSSWFRNLLTTVLGRRDTSATQPRLGWNGRPCVGATEDADPNKPATDYSTLIVIRPRNSSARGGADTLVPISKQAKHFVA